MENQDGKPLQILSECPECVLADFILR